jgi:hypothetical protein
MPDSRRKFLAKNSLEFMAATIAPQAALAQTPQSQPQQLHSRRAACIRNRAARRPEVSVQTFVEAEKLVQFEMTPAERVQAALNWARRWLREPLVVQLLVTMHRCRCKLT